MSRPAVVVDDVAKKFKLFHERHDSLKSTILSGRRARYEEFWALDGVSFEVREGSTIGLIGENGSGKSTLLKCMARILLPDRGRITISGKVSALLELGAGFHPDLSGRENVYLNASILGMSKKEVDLRFDDIVSFAGLERFIDTPVKNYSSGMYVRLGFSVAINVEPEVLLVDEILAVGDEEFQERSAEKFAELKRSGCTIVVVSHSLDQMRSICEEVVLLEHGKLVAIGKSGEIVDKYLGHVRDDRRAREAEERARYRALVPTDEPAEIPLVSCFELLDDEGHPTSTARSNDPLTVRVTYDARRIGEPVRVALSIYRTDGAHVVSLNTGYGIAMGEAGEDGSVTVDYRIPSLPLQTGVYEWSLALHDTDMLHIFERAERLRFDVTPGDFHDQRGLVDLGGEFVTRGSVS
ncbi:MAG: Vitamin B12 import ATP-binding protein BtuD [Acidimicrobiales bacterium]|nr:Vitamin B12 import ATP-binding protein BtuD [Acidimicrobiales bacterium]